MQTILTEPKLRGVRDTCRRPMPEPSKAAMCTALEDFIEDLHTSRGFTALLAAYRASGGTLRGDDVARLREEYGLGDFVSLAKSIATNEVFGFEWRGTLWIPMFQFNLGDLSLRPSTGTVLAALGASFTGWERAAWFSQPNKWLQRRKPLDMMEGELPDVLDAARSDRLAAIG